ncbi:MAG: glycosyltransferase, partial [Rhodospirillaceae bacterium]
MPQPAETGDTRRRVLLVIAGLPAGGAERQMALLAQGLDRSRFAPGLLIFNREDRVHYREAITGDIWFRALGLSGSSAPRLAPALLRGIAAAVRDFAPDIVHSSLNVANHMVRASALLYGWRTPIITSVRNDFTAGYRAREKFAERILWRRSAAITCNADRVRDQIVSALPIPPNRVVTIPNGIDESFFSDISPPPPAWWPDGHVALCIGRFTDQKNPLGLIRAFARISTGEAIANWKLAFVGEG